MVSVEHLFSQLTVLDPTGELNVSELITQELWPQEALRWHTQNGATCITVRNKKLYLVQQLWCWSKKREALRCTTEDLRCRMGPTDSRKQLLVLAANIIHPLCDSDIEHCRPQNSRSAHVWASDWQIIYRMPYLSCLNLPPLHASSACSFVTHLDTLLSSLP